MLFGQVSEMFEMTMSVRFSNRQLLHKDPLLDMLHAFPASAFKLKIKCVEY